MQTDKNVENLLEDLLRTKKKYPDLYRDNYYTKRQTEVELQYRNQVKSIIKHRILLFESFKCTKEHSDYVFGCGCHSCLEKEVECESFFNLMNRGNPLMAEIQKASLVIDAIRKWDISEYKKYDIYEKNDPKEYGIDKFEFKRDLNDFRSIQYEVAIMNKKNMDMQTVLGLMGKLYKV